MKEYRSACEMFSLVHFPFYIPAFSCPAFSGPAISSAKFEPCIFRRPMLPYK